LSGNETAAFPEHIAVASSELSEADTARYKVTDFGNTARCMTLRSFHLAYVSRIWIVSSNTLQLMSLNVEPEQHNV